MIKYPTVLTLIIMIFLCQCRDKNNLSGPTRNIFSFTWGTSDQIWIENSRFHSFKYLDTVANQLAGDSLIPISFLENDKIIIRKLEPTSLEMSEIEGNTEFLITDAVFLPDTFTFATKNYIDKQFLILYSNTAASRVYELKTLDVEIPEIRPDYQPQFEIRGYSVGDIIDRDQIEVIYSDIFGSMKTEEVVISDDLNVKFTVIGNQYIEKIERSNIRNQELHSLIRAIDKIFTNDHEYEEIVNGTGEFKETVKGYYWTEKDVSIFLQKVETSFEDPEDSFWRLQYSNHIITNILQNYLEFSPDNI